MMQWEHVWGSKISPAVHRVISSLGSIPATQDWAFAYKVSMHQLNRLIVASLTETQTHIVRVFFEIYQSIPPRPNFLTIMWCWKTGGSSCCKNRRRSRSTAYNYKTNPTQTDSLTAFKRCGHRHERRSEVVSIFVNGINFYFNITSTSCITQHWFTLAANSDVHGCCCSRVKQAVNKSTALGDTSFPPCVFFSFIFAKTCMIPSVSDYWCCSIVSHTCCANGREHVQPGDTAFKTCVDRLSPYSFPCK